jgi:hypothetical protein
MIVTLTLNAGVKPELCFVNAGAAYHRRFVRMSGAPSYRSTYKYWDFKLLANGKPVPRPTLLSIVIGEAEAESEGMLSYVEAYEDDELGLKELTQFSFEAEYPPAVFEKLWSLLNSPVGIFVVSISVKAPRTDISGHKCIFEVSEASNGWPAEFYASRN